MTRLAPACTAWAKAVRYKSYKHDDVYIVRQDGHVRLIEIDEADQLLLKTTSPAGDIHNPVGTAFACLDVGLRNAPDMIIAGGYMGMGGVYLVSHDSRMD